MFVCLFVSEFEKCQCVAFFLACELRGETCRLESNLFSISESEELDNQARKIECGTLVLEPEGTRRDIKKSPYCKFKETLLAVDASVAYDHMKELEKTVDYESFMRECLACESVYTTKISNLEIP